MSFSNINKISEEYLTIILASKESPNLWKKEALALNPWKKLKRYLGENVFNHYQDQMAKLREVDDKIQFWSKDLKRNLKEAKNNFKSHNLIDTVYWLGQINNRLKLISTTGKEISRLMDQQVDEFYQHHEVSDLDQYFDPNINLFGNGNENLLRQAGILDNLGRRFLGSHLERSHLEKIKNRNDQIRKLLTITETVVIMVDKQVSILEKARSYGEIDQYLKAVEKISKYQSEFETNFKNTYDTHLAGLFEKVKQQKAQQAKEIKEQEDSEAKTVKRKDLGAQDLPLPKTINDSLMKAVNEPKIDLQQFELASKIPKLPPIPSHHSTKRSPVHENKNYQSEVFDQTLTPEEVKADNSPLQLPNLIDTDPESFTKSPANSNRGKKTDLTATLPSEGVAPLTKQEILNELNSSDLNDLESTKDTLIKQQHTDFFSHLLKLSKLGKSKALINDILKYSELLEYTQPEQSLQLLAVAEGLLNE